MDDKHAQSVVGSAGLVMGDVKAVAAKYGVDPRSVSRWADTGLIPYGAKLSAARRWNLAEIDGHIAAGCPRVRTVSGKAVRA